jgi:hypothetical protein
MLVPCHPSHEGTALSEANAETPTATQDLPLAINREFARFSRKRLRRLSVAKATSSTGNKEPFSNLHSHTSSESAANFLREFRNSLTLDSADGEIFGSWREFAFWAGDRGRSVGRATARFGVDHSWCGIRYSDDEHPEMNQRDHHRDAGRLLSTVCGSRRGEDTNGLAFHRTRQPEAGGTVNERFHLRGHVPVTCRRAKQHAVGFTKIIERADLNVLLFPPDLRFLAVTCLELFFNVWKFRRAAEEGFDSGN